MLCANRGNERRPLMQQAREGAVPAAPRRNRHGMAAMKWALVSPEAATGPPTQMNGGLVSAALGGINVDGPDGTRS